MKFALHILALYTLLLSCFPCQDGLEPHADEANVSVSITGIEHPPHQGGNDQCTPFCTCTCCAGLEIPVLKTILPQSPSTGFVKPSVFFRASVAPSGARFSIWQPPRV